MQRPAKQVREQHGRSILAGPASVATLDSGVVAAVTMPPVARKHAFARRKIRPA